MSSANGSPTDGGFAIPIEQFSPCDLHFPHKDWSDDDRERENYLAVERWAYHFRTGCPDPREGTPVAVGSFHSATAGFSPCDLHIPHKEWADDRRERENYSEMERWANYFRRNCCAGGLGGGGEPPSPPILVVQLSQHEYCDGLSPPAAVEDDVRYSGSGISIQAPGITTDALNGTGIPVQPYSYTSAYYSDPVHWFFPAATNLRITLKASFSEQTTTGATALQPVTRSLHLWIENAGGTSFAHVYANAMGTRYGPIAFQLDAGPYDIPNPFTIHTYCLWNTVATPNGNRINHLTDGLTVTGNI